MANIENVYKSYNCRSLKATDVKTILDRIVFDKDSYVGDKLSKGRFNSLIIAEDGSSGTLCFGDGSLHRVPKCFSRLFEYIKSLYEEDLVVSSMSIYEGRHGRVVVDITSVKTNEVYGYSFGISSGEVRYEDEHSDTLGYIRYDEQYFLSLDSDEPDGRIFSKLVEETLYFCKKFNFPIKRVCIYSEGSEISLKKAKCRYGVGFSKNYYGLDSFLYSEEEYILDEHENDEYDLCILVEG